MSSIGESLRRERQKRNLELDQISRDLKISSRFLQAIEDEHFDQLPAGVFAKSFVRQYATLLGLDADEMVAEVHRMLAPEPLPGAPLAEPQRESLGTVPELNVGRGEEWERVGDRRNWSSSLPAFALVVVVMLVCSGLYAFWQRERHPAASAAPVTAKRTVPPQQAPQPGAQTATAAAQAPAEAPAPEPAQPAAGQPAGAANAQPPAAQQSGPVAVANAAAPPAPTPTAPAQAAATTANPPTPAAAGSGAPANGASPQAASQSAADRTAAQTTPGGPVKVEITAAEPVWVLARANGKYLFSGTLEANQTKSLEASGTVLLRVGNAGGLNITLNGKPIGPVGPKGQVRDVQFTSGGFQIVAAPKPPSPPPGE